MFLLCFVLFLKTGKYGAFVSFLRCWRPETKGELGSHVSSFCGKGNRKTTGLLSLSWRAPPSDGAWCSSQRGKLVKGFWGFHLVVLVKRLPIDPERRTKSSIEAVAEACPLLLFISLLLMELEQKSSSCSVNLWVLGQVALSR